MPSQLEGTGLPAVELAAVTKSFGPTTAVDDVSFVAAQGEFYSLLGPSGCGKTTTLRLIAGFERPDRGRISIVGKDVSAVPAHKRQVNTVFQQYALFPHLSVEDNVSYGLRQRRLPKDQIRGRLEEALATVRLTDLRDRMPRQLSGGQQQRVALARALINEPAALLLDEPLAALDLKLRKALQGELKSLQERVGITFIYVTHDQEEALTLSDRIAVMSGGRIVQEGTPEDIYERPRTRFVADFIGQTNFFEGEVTEVGAETIVRATSGNTIRCAPASWARKGQWVAVSVRPEKIVPANGTSSEHNRYSGTLVRRTYLGDTVLYRIELPDRTEVVCRRQNEGDDPSARWEVGGEVTIGWPADAALVLTADETAVEEDIHLLDDAPDRAGGKERP